MHQSGIDVSVIVPCYNTERFLDQALSSIEANSTSALEIIAVNDGSTDESLCIMRAHEQKDPRVRVIDKPNGGYGSAVNAGMRAARGIYVAILEPDDWADPHMYDELVAFARGFCKNGELSDPHAPDVVKSPYWRVIGCNTNHQQRLHCIFYQRIHPAGQPFCISDAPRLIRHHPSIWSALYRREFLETQNITMQEVPGAGWVDTTFGFAALVSARRIVYLDRPFYNYREDLAGSSSNRKIGILSFTRWLQMADFAQARGIESPDVWKALAYVGLRYITGARREGSLEDPQVQRVCKQLCCRLDPRLVAELKDAAPAARAYVLKCAGHEVPPMSSWGYYRSLVAEFFYSMRANGIGFALKRIALAFH